MRTAPLLAGLCLLLTAAPASALLGDTTVDVGDHHFEYHDPSSPYCEGDIHLGNDRYPVEVQSGSGGPHFGECSNHVRVG